MKKGILLSLVLILIVGLFSPFIKASASTSTNPVCTKYKGVKKVMWDGIELKTGQIGRLTVVEDTPLYKVEGENKTFSRTLKKGEFYRIYAFKPGMLSMGGGYYVDRDDKVTYSTPSKEKLQAVKCINGVEDSGKESTEVIKPESTVGFSNTVIYPIVKGYNSKSKTVQSKWIYLDANTGKSGSEDLLGIEFTPVASAYVGTEKGWVFQKGQDVYYLDSSRTNVRIIILTDIINFQEYDGVLYYTRKGKNSSNHETVYLYKNNTSGSSEQKITELSSGYTSNFFILGGKVFTLFENKIKNTIELHRIDLVSGKKVVVKTLNTKSKFATSYHKQIAVLVDNVDETSERITAIDASGKEVVSFTKDKSLNSEYHSVYKGKYYFVSLTTESSALYSVSSDGKITKEKDLPKEVVDVKDGYIYYINHEGLILERMPI